MRKLVTVNSKELKNKLVDSENITFLYPLKDYCIGFDQTFDITEIDDFVLINRILTDDELDKLAEILANSNIKGIIFDDLGVLEIIQDMNIMKILLLDHIATNVRSINYYLDYVDSVVVSNDLTKDEIDFIIKNAKKRVVLNIFGLKKLMYSRRHLLTNYAKHHDISIEKKRNSIIEDKEFIIKENEYGTCFYAGKYYNALELLNSDNVLYYWYNLVGINDDEAVDIVINSKVNVPNDTGFLYQKTFYKLKGGKND